MTNIIICGGRRFNDRAFIYNKLCGLFCLPMQNKLAFSYHDPVLFCGMANGADMLARDWAENHGWDIKKFPAEWDKYGKKAGIIRNSEMIRAGAHVTVAFWDGASPGTSNMISLSLLYGLELHVFHFS